MKRDTILIGISFFLGALCCFTIMNQLSINTKVNGIQSYMLNRVAPVVDAIWTQQAQQQAQQRQPIAQPQGK
jgi:6,7-dimethyl-8-ribityllumazine synthase